MFTLLKWVILAGLVGYACLILVLYLAQRSLLYVPSTLRTTPGASGLPQAQEIVLVTSDGEKVIAWYVPPKDAKPLVIYLHGNAEILPWKVDRHREIVADGTGLLALSYRGYAGSTGSPTEDGLHRDADAAYALAVAQVPPERIVVWGHSLGTGVAVRLAAERRIGKLVLEAPYTSAVDIAARAYPFAPVRLMMKDQFRSDLRIADVTAPVLVLHGGRDDVIPIAFGERLYGMIRAPKRFVRFAEGGHIDLDAYGALAAVRAFMADTALEPPKAGAVD